METRFANRAGRWLLLLGVLLVPATLTILGGKNALAEHWAQSRNPDDWLRAARLEPGNANHWYRLGRYRQLDFEHSDLVLAISYYRRALAIDPRSAEYWMGLAGAHEASGDPERALHAFEAAKSAYPISAEVEWRYGNFLLRRGQQSAAFAEIRRGVATDHRLATLGISRCWRATRDIQEILDEAMPADGEVYLAMLDFLVGEHEGDAALAVWNRLLALHTSLELRRAFPLLEELIQRERVAEALHVWQQALEAAGVVRPNSAGESLVWDGGFERDFSNGGFGWRQKEVAGAAFEFDTESHHSGARSLRVSFDGTANLDFAHLTQLVPVEPRHRYRFAAFLRTEGISTDSGIRFAIFDPRRPSVLSHLTADLVGTHAWTPQEFEFIAGPETRLVEIVLRRLPSQKFDNKLKGTVWADDVSLVALPAEGARPSP